MKPPRKALTKALERKIFLEAGSRCPWCPPEKKLLFAEASIHHIDGDRSNNVLVNLILACNNHHGHIENGLIPRWEVELKKTCLVNPQTLERLGLAPLQPLPKVKAKKQKATRQMPKKNNLPVEKSNSGIIAKTIHNSGVMAGTVKYEGAHIGPIQVTGSLATSVDHYGYIEYLLKRLSHYRSWRPGGGGPPDNPGAVRKIFQNHFGRLPKDVPLERFDDAVAYFVEKIQNTVLGRIGKARVSNFSEWKRKGGLAL